MSSDLENLKLNSSKLKYFLCEKKISRNQSSLEKLDTRHLKIRKTI